VASPHIYTVVSGDTLGAIAHRFGTTVKRLVDLNAIANPDLIPVGLRLRIA
jgi:LysM repeat protein